MQEWVYYGKLKESEEPMLPQILKLCGAVARLNPRILPAADSDNPSSGDSLNKLLVQEPVLLDVLSQPCPILIPVPWS